MRVVFFFFFSPCREQLEMVIDQLKVKLQDAQHNSQMNASELQALQSEHDTLLERHNKMLQETVAKEAELREKYGLLLNRYRCFILCELKGWACSGL